MHASRNLSSLHLAAAEALGAGRAAARLLRSPASAPIRHAAGSDLDALAGRLSRSGALSGTVAADVRSLLARCDAFIAQGTIRHTEWMPKSVCGDDVTKWEPWTREKHTPEAAGLRTVVEALRCFLDHRDHVADLVRAETALAVLRGDRDA